VISKLTRKDKEESEAQIKGQEDESALLLCFDVKQGGVEITTDEIFSVGFFENLWLAIHRSRGE